MGDVAPEKGRISCVGHFGDRNRLRDVCNIERDIVFGYIEA